MVNSLPVTVIPSVVIQFSAANCPRNPSKYGTVVKVGAVESTTSMVWVAVDVLPQASVAENVLTSVYSASH